MFSRVGTAFITSLKASLHVVNSSKIFRMGDTAPSPKPLLAHLVNEGVTTIFSSVTFLT